MTRLAILGTACALSITIMMLATDSCLCRLTEFLCVCACKGAACYVIRILWMAASLLLL